MEEKRKQKSSRIQRRFLYKKGNKKSEWTKTTPYGDYLNEEENHTFFDRLNNIAKNSLMGRYGKHTKKYADGHQKIKAHLRPKKEEKAA